MCEANELTEEELRRLEELSNAATKGPWKSSIEGRDHECGGPHVVLTGEDVDIELLGAATIANHDFIAAARQAVPRLIAEVRALREALRRAKG